MVTPKYGFRKLAEEAEAQKQEAAEALRRQQEHDAAQLAILQAEEKENAHRHQQAINSFASTIDAQVREIIAEFAASFNFSERILVTSDYGFYAWEIGKVNSEGHSFLFHVKVTAYLNERGNPEKYLNLRVTMQRGELALFDVIDQEVFLAGVLNEKTRWPVVYISDYHLPRRKVRQYTQRWWAQHWLNDMWTSNIYFGYPKFAPRWMFWRYTPRKAP
jgi:hypothetical protein